MCERALTIVDEVIDELVNHRLLVKENQIFKKTDNLSEFYYTLKSIFEEGRIPSCYREMRKIATNKILNS